MFAFCLKNIQDEEVAKEIVQEVFKSLWERRDSLRLKEVERYLIRAVKLKTFEYIRNKVTRQQHLENFTTNKQNYYVEYPLIAEELSQKISKLVSRDQGLTNKEIATKLYISERAVEYHISKALKTLKMELTDYIN